MGPSLSSDQVLSAIASDSDDAIIGLGLDGCVLTWNEAADRLYGYSHEDVAGLHIDLVASSEGRAELRELILQGSLGHGVKGVEGRHLTKSGDVRDVLLTLSPVNAENADKPVGLALAVRDITSVRRTERDLLRTDQRFRAMFERSGHGIAVTTIDGQLIEVNGAMAEILGYERPEDVYDAKLHMPSLYKHVEVRDQLVATVQESGLLEAVETELLRRDGSYAWVSLNMVPILDSAGTVSGLQTMVMDVTLKRSLERQLYHAQKMEAVGRLTGGIAHDFNNILSVIMNYVDFALVEVKGGVRDDLQEVQNAAERAAALVRQLLTFSRRDVIIPKVLDLNEKIKDAQRILERTLSADIRLDVDLTSDLWRVELDPTHVEQILLNLAVNARDAMRDGGRLSIATENRVVDEVLTEQNVQLAPGNYVCVTVSDTGTGMSEETIAHLFEPFYTTKSRESGTGLGLATVHGIVTTAAGAIHVYSERGVGSTFRIFLPATDAPADPGEKAPDEVLRGEGRILLVDDEPALASIGGRVLERAGYEVKVASSAHDALVIAEGYDLDILVTDVVMPGLSGADLALRVRGSHPQARVLLMSGYSEDLLAHRGFFSAEHRLLTKPFAAAQLLRAVRATLEEKDDPAAARWRMRTPTVVLIDENRPVRALIRNLLEEAGYTVLGTYADPEEGIGAVRDLGPHYVIIDVLIPNSELVATTLRSEYPLARIVAVSGASMKKPDWADALLSEFRLDAIKDVLGSIEDPPPLTAEMSLDGQI